MYFKQEEAISYLSFKPLKLVDQFQYLGSNISSTESDVNICLVKVWNDLDKLLIRRKPDISNKIKRVFFQAVAVSIQLYGCTTWMVTKHKEKKLDRNYTRMLCAILNKSWKKHSTKTVAV